MSFQKKEIVGSNISVLLVAKPNSLSISLANEILRKNLELIILIREPNAWKDQIFNNGKATFITKSQSKKLKCGYIVYVNLTEYASKKELKELQSDIETVVKLAKENYAKIVSVFSVLQEKNLFKKTSLLKNKILNKEELQSNILFIGCLVDDKFQKNTFLGGLLSELKNESFINIPRNLKSVYFANSESVRKIITKALFSFGTKESELSIISKPLKIENIIDLLKDIKEDLGIKYVNKYYYLRETKRKDILEISFIGALRRKFKQLEKNVYEIGSNKFTNDNKDQKKSLINIENIKYFFFSITLRDVSTKRRFILFLGSSLVFVLPYLLLLSSVFLLHLSIENIRNGNFAVANRAFLISEKLSEYSEIQLGVYSKIPFVGNKLSEMKNTSNILKEISTVGIGVVDLMSDVHELETNIKDKKKYDVRHYSKAMLYKVEDIYQKSGFILADIDDNKFIKYILYKRGIRLYDLLEIRKKAYEARNVIEEIPDLLAYDSRKKYMILFQNNMELRPAGGFIGSFAIAKFTRGYLDEIKVHEVFDADMKLKGYVDPPDPIYRYLSSSGWYLRDSNWDPDFTKSAKAAEWFLEKEMGIQVDGVIAVDLNYLKNIVSDYDDIEIKSHNLIINKSNFYTTIQKQVENKYFLESEIQSSLLSSLADEIIYKMLVDRSVLSLNFLSDLYESLEERNVQIYLRNQKAQVAIDKNNWSGSLRILNCGENCFFDYISEVEANLGVNKANYFIQRSMKLNTKINTERINRVLAISLTNSSGEERDFPWYKTYIRVITPEGVDFGPVVLEKNGQKTLLEPEINIVNGFSEAGVYIEIFPKEEVVLRFSWEGGHKLDFDKDVEYVAYVRKQAGTNQDPLLVKVEIDSDDTILTESNQFLYNTVLDRDKIFRSNW
jgi:hypothetical protein